MTMIDSNNIELVDKLDQEIDKWVQESQHQFNLLRRPKKHPEIAIQAFANVGFVANIALHYLMENYPHRRIAGFFSDIIPSFINYYETELFFPVTVVELDVTTTESILLTLGEVPISGYALFTITDALYNLYQKLGIEQVLHLDSFLSNEKDNARPISYIFGSDTSLANELRTSDLDEDFDTNKGIKHIFGLGASCKILFRSIDVCSVLIGTESEQPNEVSAYTALKILKRRFDIPIDSEEVSTIAEIYERKSRQIFGIKREHDILQNDQSNQFKNEYY